MRLDLVPQSRKKKKRPIKVKSCVDLSKRQPLCMCVCECMCVSECEHTHIFGTYQGLCLA